MNDYDAISYVTSERFTKKYSTSFSISILLFDASLRKHIYAIYGLVRVADEIVDTYQGKDAGHILNDLEADVYRALTLGYSANPIVHAFALTARKFAVKKSLVKAFFVSMRMDLEPRRFTQKTYGQYIFGSAEAVGLMCLAIFTNSKELYVAVESGARRLGAAYQKINFLRDIAADAVERKRWYFPFDSLETFNEKTKRTIVRDIERDLKIAKKAIALLPDSSRKAVTLSYSYYASLLTKIKRTPATVLASRRIRINNIHKFILMARSTRA